MEIVQSRQFGTRASIAGAMLTAALLGLITYAGAINNKFVYDDYPIIIDNPLVNQSGPWYRFWIKPYWPVGMSADKLYRPLTVWSFRANVVLSGRDKPDPNNARAFHVVNVTLHALTSVGVALLAWRVTRRPWAAWLGGALFATHPLHTETVVTGYGRSELLAGFFAVYLMARYLRPGSLGEDSGEGQGDGGTGGQRTTIDPQSAIRNPQLKIARFHLVNALLLLLAVMSKEHALFVWPMLLLYDIWQYRQMPASRRVAVRKWLNDVAAPAHAAFILAIATFFFFRFVVFGQFYRLDSSRVRFWESPVAHANLIEHILTPFRLLWLTLKITVWPPALCPIWSIRSLSIPNELAPDVIAGMLLLLGLLGLAIVLWRRGSPLGALLVGLLMLLAIPVQALPMAHWLYAERWLYLPSVLMAVLVAAGLARVPVAGWAVGLTAAVVLLPASWQYASKFADNLTLASEVVKRQPDNFQGRRNLASLLYLAGDYDGAIREAQEVIERFGESVCDPYGILAESYLALGKGREALGAIKTYEWIRRDIPMPDNLTNEGRRRAEALIAQSAAASRPATFSTSIPGS